MKYESRIAQLERELEEIRDEYRRARKEDRERIQGYGEIKKRQIRALQIAEEKNGKSV